MKHIYQQENFGEHWFTYPTLYSDMVKKFPCGSRFVEVGSWKGKSSSYMAVEIINSNKKIEFTCVDTWKGSACTQELNTNDLYEIFKINMKPLENYYKDLKMTSIEASALFENNSLDFVFIDASHEYEDVKNDIISWLPKIKRGGVLAGHDYWSGPDSWPSVRKAVNETLSNIISTDEGCWIYNVV